MNITVSNTMTPDKWELSAWEWTSSNFKSTRAVMGTITKIGEEFKVVIGEHVSVWTVSLFQLCRIVEEWYWQGFI